MKKIKRIGSLVLCMLVLMGVVPVRAWASEPGTKVEIAGENIASYNAGEKERTLDIEVSNLTDAELHNVVVTPKVKANINVWPFEIEKKSLEQKIDVLKPGAENKATLQFPVTVREKVESKYYKVQFTVKADGIETTEHEIFVKMTAKPEEKEEQKEEQKQEEKEEQKQEETGKEKQPDEGAPAADAGGFYNAEPVSSGGGESASTSGSVPRVIVTGFSTEPKVVKAGMDFKLIVHLKNTSKKTAVQNLLFDFGAPTEGEDAATTSPAFLPSSGSSSVYLEKIKANGTKDISIDLNAKPDLTQKPYSVELSMKYEDTSGSQFEASSSISVPVKQDARFEFSDFELSSESVEVGGQANVMCSLYNLGRVKLYNVKAKFEGEGITSKETFVGNVEPGATASIDNMLTGESETTGDGKVKMVVTYEDESGKIQTAEKELTLFVTAPMEDDGMMTDGEAVTEEPKGFPVGMIVILAVVVVAVIAIVVVVKMRKKKKAREEEEELANELDGFAEDEQRES